MPQQDTPRRRLARPIRAAVVSCAAAGATLALPAGCSMDAIDKRITRVVGQRSAELGTPPARLRSDNDVVFDREARFEKTPGTANPALERLEFDPADPNRDVLTRLDGFYEPSEADRPLDLAESFRLSQTSAREFLSAEEDYVFAAISLLIERHRWGPRFFNDTTLGINAGDEGNGWESELRVINELRATQRLPYGGEVEARFIAQATQELINAAGDDYTQAGSLVIGADIPLLRDAGLIAQEELIQRERNLVYAARSFERFRRELLVSIARDYFGLVADARSIRNQMRRLDNLRVLLEQRRAQAEAGRRAAFEARNVEQNVLRSRVALINSQEQFKLRVDRFKIRLGLPIEAPVEVAEVSLDVPEPIVTVAEASMLALRYRLDYQNSVDRLDDARRGVDNAKNQILPDLDVNARAFIASDDFEDQSIVEFDLDDSDYNLSITFGLPLDREIERLNLRRRTIELERARRNLSQFRDTIVLDARAAVREIDRARNALTLQERAVEVNLLRQEELRIRADEINVQQQLDALDELLQSENDRDSALRDLRIAILDYLLATGQMRVEPNGMFAPLPGMVIRVIPGGVPGAGGAGGGPMGPDPDPGADPAGGADPAPPGRPDEAGQGEPGDPAPGGPGDPDPDDPDPGPQDDPE